MRSARGDILDFAAVDTGSSRHRSCNSSLVASPVCAEAEIPRHCRRVAAMPEEWVLDSGNVLGDMRTHGAAGYENTTDIRECRCLSARAPVVGIASKCSTAEENNIGRANWRDSVCAE